VPADPMRLGPSQVEFAGLIGRSDSWVSQVERGVRAIDRMSVLQKVADVLGVSVDELRGAEPDDSTALTERPGAFEALRLALTGHPAISAALGAEAQALTVSIRKSCGRVAGAYCSSCRS
jgi:transcriptional regulator with XRE-family HTH domain